MRPVVPNSHLVDGGFRRLIRRLATVKKRINSRAAKAMKASDYRMVEQWMNVGRSVEEFTGRAEAFAAEWKRLVKTARFTAQADPDTKASKSSGHPAKHPVTPLWRFCEPALQSIAARGGKATTQELLDDLKGSLVPRLERKDLEVVSKYKMPRWQLSVKRARRVCEREGWVNKRKDEVWELTDQGRGLVTGRREGP